MENLMRNRDHSLLGHAPRDPFASPDALPGGLTRRTSDLDFHDVFGGPPTRRSSIYERHSLGESVDTYASGGRGGGEEALEFRRPWSSCGEKPVFGASGSPARRKLLGDDFFSDIFRGNESACTTTRTGDRDLFSSTPSSRVLSPARPLPPRSELFGGGASLPAQVSLSTKLTKGVDHRGISSPTSRTPHKNEQSVPDAFSFPSSPTTSAPAVPSQVVQVRDDLRSDAHVPYRQSPLSRQISSNQEFKETSLSTFLQTPDTEDQFKKDLSGSKANNTSSHFHFSIYKWASKGVTLVMASDSKGRAKTESRLSGLSLSTNNEKMSNECRGFESQNETQHTRPSNDLTAEGKDNIDSTKKVEEILPAMLQSEPLPSNTTKQSGMHPGINKRVPVSLQDASKPELKNLPHLLNVDLDRQGNEDRIGQAEVKESLIGDDIAIEVVDDTAKVVQQSRINTIPCNAEMTGPGSQDAPARVKDKMSGSRVKGKVKEFIKIFNQEASAKSSSTAETRGRRSRVKDEIMGKVEDQANVPVAKADKKKKMDKKNSVKTSPAAPISIDQTSEREEKPASDNKSSDAQRVYDAFSEKNETSAPYSDSTLESCDASFGNIEEPHFEDLEEFMVEQINEDHEVSEADLHKEEIQISDAKIREWSKGKEGNIRSLLSTLQYVLWPGSGWKPVPLVDIIEGASVKRAYQKALLCLHPDKLQQKGAEVHQKYIAEKIFDILQEAWTHFNSVSAL